MWLFGQTSVISAPGYLPAAGSGKALGARRVASLAVTQLFPKLPWIWEGPISVLNVKQGIFPLDGEEDYARSKSGSPTLYGDQIEIGDRLRLLLSRESAPLPPRLVRLLQAMHDQEK
jgi:hypothetical protein